MGKKITKNKKVYVLDTSSIVDFPYCLTELAKEGSFVVIPQRVTEELDGLHKKNSDVKFAAGEAIKLIYSLKEDGLINHGLEKVIKGGKKFNKLHNNGAVFWESNYSRLNEKVFDLPKGDNIILGCAAYVNNLVDKSTYDVVLKSEDINLLIKADSLSLFNAQKLEMGKSKLKSIDDLYSGVIDILVDPKTIDSFLKSGEFGKRKINAKDIPELSELYLYWNQGVMLIDKKDNSRVVPTKISSENGADLLELTTGTYWDSKNKCYMPKKISGIEPDPKDFRQALFFEFAFDPEIKLLFGYGKAGTGKTSCASAAAIKSYVDYNENNSPGGIGRRYEKGIYIMRPEYSSSRTEFSAVPGNVRQKTMPWVGPIIDKLKEQRNYLENGKFDINKIVESGNSALLRGKDIKDYYVIFDEWQNAGRVLNNVALTRLNQSSKCVVLGDICQIDNRFLTWRNSAITLNIDFLKGKHKAIAIVNLTHNYRSPLSRLVEKVNYHTV